jgi:hypothetical protein
MGKKGGAPAPPDYSAIAAANKEAAEIQAGVAREQLAWAKDQYAQDKETVNKVVDRALQTQDINDKNAAADRLRYEQKYQPLEDQAIADAQTYASPERKAIEEGRAEATVADQFTQARNAATQNLEAFGVDPTSTRFAALDIGSRTQQAAAQAAAGNQAGQMVDATGRALRSEAINVGRGYPGQVAATYGTALQAGNQAVNSTLAGTQTGANTMGTAPQYYGLQSNFLNNWGNNLTQGYNAQLAQYNANQNSSSGWGSALGLIGGMGMKALMFADGGAIPDDASEGGHVPTSASPTGGAAIDDVAARLTPGEFVMPKDVMQWKGEEWAQKEIQKAREAKKGAVARPQYKPAPAAHPTFVSRQAGALPMG